MVSVRACCHAVSINPSHPHNPDHHTMVNNPMSPIHHLPAHLNAFSDWRGRNWSVQKSAVIERLLTNSTQTLTKVTVRTALLELQDSLDLLIANYISPIWRRLLITQHRRWVRGMQQIWSKCIFRLCLKHLKKGWLQNEALKQDQ